MTTTRPETAEHRRCRHDLVQILDAAHRRLDARGFPRPVRDERGSLIDTRPVGPDSIYLAHGHRLIAVPA